VAQTAVAAAPDEPAINDTLGWVYYKKGFHGQAIAAFRHSVQKDGTNAVYHYHLGLAYAKNGDGAKARQSLEKALVLDPNFAGASDARKVLASIVG
jgi:Flp pilus assembly protein TadD